jgi:hypothetical protein
MLLVRTDRPAIVAGAAIMAFFTLEVVRTGLVIAAQDRASLDAWVVMALATGAIYGLLFLVGHNQLRKHGQRSRGAYAALGAIAAVPPFLLATGWKPFVMASTGGTLSALFVCPLVAGALMGFLYHRRAGYETEGDDVAALAGTAPQPGASSAASGTIDSGTAEYFDGPLVVRTSLGANAIASLLGGAVFVLAISFTELSGPYQSPMGEYMAMNGAGRTMLQGIIGIAIPIALLLGVAHGMLRARGKHSYAAYAVAGLIGPAIVSVLIAMTGISLLALAYLLQFLAPSLVAMLAYRRLAGLEPAPLPDDIEVSDRRTLVGADHVRRRVARVIDVSVK